MVAQLHRLRDAVAKTKGPRSLLTTSYPLLQQMRSWQGLQLVQQTERSSHPTRIHLGFQHCMSSLLLLEQSPPKKQQKNQTKQSVDKFEQQGSHSAAMQPVAAHIRPAAVRM